MEPMLIVVAVVIGGIAALISGAIARRAGIFWGAALPALVIAFTVYSANMKVPHHEGAMGHGILVLFILMPLSAVTVLGWAVGLGLRHTDRRRQSSDR
jgi:hypothetical protein